MNLYFFSNWLNNSFLVAILACVFYLIAFIINDPEEILNVKTWGWNTIKLFLISIVYCSICLFVENQLIIYGKNNVNFLIIASCLFPMFCLYGVLFEGFLLLDVDRIDELVECATLSLKTFLLIFCFSIICVIVLIVTNTISNTSISILTHYLNS